MQKAPVEDESVRIKFVKSINSWWISFKSLLNFLYNHETREVIGRDGLSWTKVVINFLLF